MANIKAIHRLSLYDPATGDVVLLNRLSTDGGYEKEPIATEVSDGTIFGGYTHTLTAIFFDMPGGARAQLETWEEAGTELNCVGLSDTGAMLWYHPTEMTGFIDSLQTNARDGVSPFQFELTTSVPYADIYTGTNILRAAMKRNDIGRTQYDQTEKYAPLRVHIRNNASWELENFGITTSGSGTDGVALRFPFPMPNVPFFFGAKSPVVGVYRMRQYSFSETEVEEVITDYGRDNSTVTLPTCYYMDFGDMPNGQLNSECYIRIDKAGYTNE